MAGSPAVAQSLIRRSERPLHHSSIPFDLSFHIPGGEYTIHTFLFIGLLEPKENMYMIVVPSHKYHMSMYSHDILSGL